MSKRHKVGKRHSKNLFRHTASKFHNRNVHHFPMRGGIRM